MIEMQIVGFSLALLTISVGVAIYIWLCFKYPPSIPLAAVAYSMISKSASVVYLEQVPTYIIEVSLISGNIGASLRHMAYNSLIFGVALFVIWRLVNRNSRAVLARKQMFGTRTMDEELWVAIVLSSSLLAIQLVNALLSPPYALPGLGINRQQFWAGIRSPLVADLIGVLVVYVPSISGAATAYAKVTGKRSFKRAAFWLTAAYCFYFLLTGARFNGSLLALLFWLAPYWIVLWVFGQAPKIRRLGLVVTVAVSLFVFVGYLEIADRGISQMTGSTWNGFLYRVFALQGDIYFAADLRAQEGQTASLALLTQGMERTLIEYMPSKLAEIYAYKGVNLAGSLPGNSILVFGFWIGMLPMIIYGIILGFIAGSYVYFIITGRFLFILPTSYMCLWTYSGYTHGSFSIFSEYKFLIVFALFVFWLIIPRNQDRRHHRQPRASVVGARHQ